METNRMLNATLLILLQSMPVVLPLSEGGQFPAFPTIDIYTPLASAPGTGSLFGCTLGETPKTQTKLPSTMCTSLNLKISNKK